MPGFIHRLFGKDDMDVDCLQSGEKERISEIYLKSYLKSLKDPLCGVKDQVKAGTSDQR